MVRIEAPSRPASLLHSPRWEQGNQANLPSPAEHRSFVSFLPSPIIPQPVSHFPILIPVKHISRQVRQSAQTHAIPKSTPPDHPRCSLPLEKLQPRCLAGRRAKNHGLLAASSFVPSPLFDRLRESAATLQRSVLVASGSSAAGGAHGRDGQVRGRGLAGGRRFRGGRRDAGRGGVAWREAGSGPVVVRGGGAESDALWKHDVEIMWVLLGAIANSLLSQILKKTLNHERPAPALRSDPGMPSSHAQSFFYAATILVLSLFYWLRANYLAMILGPAILSVATYLSWLRVSQGLHTLNQFIVGAAVGFAFGALWFVLWHSLVQEALISSPSLQNAVVLGSAVFCVGFSIYVIRHWLKDE